MHDLSTRSFVPFGRFFAQLLCTACILGALAAPPTASAQTPVTPVMQRWGTYLGGDSGDVVLSVATDDFGHVYVAGRATDSLLLGNDTTAQSGLTHQDRFGGGEADAFLAKFAPQGAMLWCTYFGGPGTDEAVRVVVTGMHGVYLVGTTTSADSIATGTLALQQTIGGGKDLFVAQFSENGLLTGATYFGGSGDEMATGAALDGTGKLVVCAYTNYPDTFPGGLTPVQPWTAGEDGLLLRFNGTSALMAGTFVGGEGDDRLVQVAMGDSGGTVVLGNTNSSSGIATDGAFTLLPQGGQDAFLLKVDTALMVVHGTYFGGEADDDGLDIIRRGDTLAIAGATWSEQLHTDSSSLQPATGGGGDGFLALLDTALALHWCTFFGDTGHDMLAAVALDGLGGIYAAGTTTAVQQLSVPDTLGNAPGTTDAIILRLLSPDSLDWVVQVPADSSEESRAMALMGHTSIYLGGRTSSSVAFGHNPHQTQFGGGPWDGFAMRWDQRRSTSCSGIGMCSGNSGVDTPQGVYHVCLGDSIMFVAYGGALGYASEWLWYVDQCGVNENFLTSGDTIVLYPEHDFTLYVRAEGSDDVTGCSFAQIVVHEMPEPVVQVSDTVCAGATIMVQGTGAETFTWSVADSVVATGAATAFAAPMAGGTIQVVAAGTNGPACTVEVSATVVVLPAPAIAWNLGHGGCAGEPGMAQLALADPSFTDTARLTFAWLPDSLHGPLATDLPAGTYVVATTDTVSGCSRTDSLTILAPPTLGMIWNTTHISCQGEPGSIALVLPDSTMADPLLTITWAESGLEGPVVQGLAAGTYIVNVSDTMGCSRTDTLVVLLPPSATVQWQATLATCHGGSDGTIALAQPDTGDAFMEAITITWTDSTLHGLFLDSLPAGTYSVIVSDTLGCSRTDLLVVAAPPPLMDSVITTNAPCAMPSGTAQVITASQAPGLLFDFGSGPQSSPMTGQLAPGSYSVTANDSAGCMQQSAFTIHTFGIISATIEADTLMAPSGSTVLACTVAPPGEAVTFHWTPSMGLDAPDQAITGCQVTDTTTYLLLVTSQAGCTAADTVVVVPWFPIPPTLPEPCGDFFLPDIFSPNGDGLNDVLRPLGGCITALDWSIYDRWGGLVFRSQALDAGWDGNRNGTSLPAGTYAFSLHVERSDGHPVERTGTITLQR